MNECANGNGRGDCAQYARMLVLLSAAALLLAAGCTSMDSYYKREGSEAKYTDLYHVLGLDEPGNWCDTSDTQCICMVCENETLTWPYSWLYDRSLTGGSCRMMVGCTREAFLKRDGSTDEYIHYFMIGQGTNFAEFSKANLYCNNSLRLAVRWLYSTEGYDYPMPASERAECLLEKNVLPLYILYSEGKAISVDRAAKIAARFKDSGPVILTSEFDFDPSSLSQAAAALDQAIMMKQECPSCLVAIAPRFYYNTTLVNGEPYGYRGAYDFLDYAFGDGTTYPNRQAALESIDLVAVGVNSHYSESCVGAQMIQNAMDYSAYALQKYAKPGIWAYVLIDEGGFNSAEGKGPSRCTWSTSEVYKTYTDLYRSAAPMVDSGIIGMAHYSLYGVQNGPLKCESCGMMEVDGTVSPQHTAWFGLCQHYYTERGILPLVFSPFPCADCSFSTNVNMFQLDEFISGFSPDETDLAGSEIQPSETFYTCNGQLITVFPQDIESITSTSFVGGLDECEAYPELDTYAELRDVDPVLTRAIAWSETGMDNDDEGDPLSDQCEISTVDSGDFPTVIDDPEGICGTRSAPTGELFHSMGLMQVHVYPYSMWANYPPGSYEADARWCAKDRFNPFNIEHNACVGTAILADKIENGGRPFVSRNEHKLGLDKYAKDTEEYQNLKNAITIFVSSYYYNGALGIQGKMQGWASDFYEQYTIDENDCETGILSWCCDDSGGFRGGSCCGQTNFIDYVRDCKYPQLSPDEQRKANYGFNVLSRYKALLSCEKYNVEKQRKAVEGYLEDYGVTEPSNLRP